MLDDESTNKWIEMRRRWGASLLQRFPNGIGPQADFAINHLERLRWLNEALREYTALGVVFGLAPLTLPGGKTYSNFANLSPDEECEIAKYTFDDANKMWNLASSEAEERKIENAKKEAIRAEEEKIRREERIQDDRHIALFTVDVERLQTTTELEIEQERRKVSMHDALQKNDNRSAAVGRRELLAIQARLIALEREKNHAEQHKSASDRRFGLAGIGFGVAEIAVAIILARWPHILETTSEGDLSKTSIAGNTFLTQPTGPVTTTSCAKSNSIKK